MPDDAWLRRTNTGRVVYERAKHSFTQKDIDRIIGRFVREETDFGALQDFLEDLEEKMLSQILAPLGMADRAWFVRSEIERIVGILVRWTAGVLKIQITYTVPGEKPSTTTFV